MIPIGRGQRELIIGDRQTGKTAVAIDTIINQKGQGVFCFYVAIGQKQSTVAPGRRQARRSTARWSTRPSSSPARARRRRSSSSRRTPASRWASTSATPAATRSASTTTSRSRPSPTASSRSSSAARRAARRTRATSSTSTRASSSAPRRWPTVYAIVKKGTKRRRRDIAASTARSTVGVEADEHERRRSARRSCRRPPSYEIVKDPHSGGSLTALPIIETQAGDVSAYIPTNVISITDGQIFLEADLFYSGVRPAINVGISRQPRRRQRADQGDEGDRRHAAPRPRAVPRDGGVRAVRLATSTQATRSSSSAARASSRS